MGFKQIGEELYESFFDYIRGISAEKKRIAQFKKLANKNALTSQQESEIKKFYKPYRIPNLVFHRYFTEKTGEFHKNYIPQDIYVRNIDPYMNDIRAAKHIDNKCYYDAFFRNFKQPHLLLKRVNGIWLNEKGQPASQQMIMDILANESLGFFVKEAQVSAGGKGVKFIEPSDNSYNEFKEFTNSIKTDIVVQRRLIQHEGYAKFNPSSVNSLRLYSILGLDGSVTIYSAVFRIGVGDTRVDNYASGGVSCGITSDGKLRKLAFNKKGEKTEKHPHSGIVFEGYELPFYDKAVELVKTAHPTIPHFRSVSWDIAISEDGTPLLIEANLCRGGIDLLQLCNGPLFKDDAKKILDEVFKSKK